MIIAEGGAIGTASGGSSIQETDPEDDVESSQDIAHPPVPPAPTGSAALASGSGLGQSHNWGGQGHVLDQGQQEGQSEEEGDQSDDMEGKENMLIFLNELARI